MSSDLSSKQENLSKTERLKRFYEYLAQGQYTQAAEISRNLDDFNSETERIVIAALRLKLGLEKYIG